MINKSNSLQRTIKKCSIKKAESYKNIYWFRNKTSDSSFFVDTYSGLNFLHQPFFPTDIQPNTHIEQIVESQHPAPKGHIEWWRFIFFRLERCHKHMKKSLFLLAIWLFLASPIVSDDRNHFISGKKTDFVIRGLVLPTGFLSGIFWCHGFLWRYYGD